MVSADSSPPMETFGLLGVAAAAGGGVAAGTGAGAGAREQPHRPRATSAPSRSACHTCPPPAPSSTLPHDRRSRR
ncbi:hypothetical protein EBN15_10300 [Xanthomonas cucurbitae]|nr:hypothetical protein EBN15_10300 [Xanthomonas cucurbitae]